MAKVNHTTSLQPSLLDRLIDEAPDASQEPMLDRFQTLRGMKKAVIRDLEALLNTRREALAELPSEYTEVRRSLVTYGLPDFTALSLLSAPDRNRIRRALEQTIAACEPRLERVRVTLQKPQHYDQTLRFRVDALLQIEPVPEPVTFDGMIRLNIQQSVFQGQD